MKSISYLYLIFCFVLMGTAKSYPQTKNHRFVNYDMEDGLPDNFVKCGFLDSRGILWVGAEDGLASFDGMGFTNYFHEDSGNSLPKNHISDIAEDKDGYLWISTSGGLARFDPYTHCFQSIEDQEGLLSNGTGNLYIDKNGLFWISSYRGGFFSYDQNTGEVKQYTLPGYRKDYARDTNTAHNFMEDPINLDILWITARNGLYRLDKKTGVMEHLIDSKPLPYNGISYTMHEMCFRKPDELWIGGWGCGLKKYNTKTGEVESFYYTKETGLRSNVLDFYFINDSTAWVATQNAGVGFFHLDGKKFELLPVEPDKPYAMQATNVNTIVPMENLPDGKASGQIWFMTYGKGISLYDPSNQGFSYIPLPENPDKRPFDFEIDTMAQKIYVTSRPSDYLHVYGYDGELLQKIHMKGREDESIQNSFGITRDHRGVFWIAGNNIFSYDPKKGKMQMFRHPVIDSVENARRRGYLDIVEDPQGNLWFFGLAGGLFRIDSSRQEVKAYTQAGKSDESRFNDLNLRELYVGKDGKTWLVHEYGLTAYDPKTKAFVFHDDTEWGNGIESLCVTQASNNIFWVGTHFNGLLKLVEEDGKLVLKDRISRSDGLPSELIVSIDMDKNGLLWLGTGKGVVRFDPLTGRMRLYSKEEGIPYPYIQGAVKHLPNGKLYVSNYNGFCVLDLEEYSNPMPPKVVLKKIAVFAEDLPLDTVPNFKKEITLKYDQDFFTIEYAAIAFSQPKHIRYAYRLKGYEKKWTNPPLGNTAVYTGVNPGEYEFQVMAANADGVWGNPKTLDITIMPPFWETWWFYLACGVLFIGLLLYLSHLRSQRIRMKERQRAEFEKQLASMELTALRSQMNPHFIFNCLNSIKHLITTGNNDEANAYLMNFASLIRLVLENSAKERIALSEELKMTELYVKMEKLRFDNQFVYEINPDPKLDLDFVEVPPLILQPFVENAIWHGLMHKEGKAKLEISVEEDGGMLLCIIDDNGIGREKARELKSKSATRKKSYGLRLAGNRLKLYNKLKASKTKIDMKIIDKFDNENKPEGTTVLLKIPLWKM